MKISYISWIPMVIMMGLIFGFSSQDGEESSGLSTIICEQVVNTADQVLQIAFTSAQKASYVEFLQFPIRKLAHMTEYALLALTVWFHFHVLAWNTRKQYWLSLVIAFLFACTDEFHQLFQAGRSGRFMDVLIDTTGAVIALFLCYIFRSSHSKRRLSADQIF